MFIKMISRRQFFVFVWILRIDFRFQINKRDNSTSSFILYLFCHEIRYLFFCITSGYPSNCQQSDILSASKPKYPIILINRKLILFYLISKLLINNMITKSVAILLLITFAVAYDISVSCMTSGCPPNCKQCQTISGGPFEGITFCADNSGGCNKNSSFIISFECNACSNGKDCTYTWKQNGLSLTGCTNTDDKPWLNFKGVLDILYQLAKQTDVKYDWCGNACSLSTGAVVGIVIAVVAGLGVLGVGIHLFLKRRRRFSDGYTKHNSSLIT